MEYKNYAIKAKTGMFYTTSKTQEEGYVENKYTDLETKEEKVNYHKEEESIEGKLKYIGTKESNYGERFYLTLEKDGINNTLELNIFRKETSVNDYVKAFCQYLKQLKVGAELKISLNRKTVDKKGYLYKNVFITQDGENLKWDFKTNGDESPVPKATKSINKVTKKEAWDFSDVDAFYYDLLNKYAPKYVPSAEQSAASSSHEANNDTPANSAPPMLVADNSTVEFNDDLPF
jgi:hypothetical protein